MEFEKVLNESFHRYNLRYKGTRPDYEIHDPRPYIIAVDEKYNPDGNGKSILGINLNYYNGNVEKIINDINKNDNDKGFRGFEIKTKLQKRFNKNKDISEWEENERKRRYNSLIEQFPYMAKYIRRYKVTGPRGTGILDKTRKIAK
ncbi:MAG: hypothetical protein ACOC3V_05290 [bacterium]